MKPNNTKYSHADKTFENVVTLIFVLGFLAFILFMNVMTHEKQQKRQNILQSFQFEDVVSFKIHPESAYAKDYRDAYDFTQAEEMKIAFFKAFSKRGSYRPQHDQAIVQWGIQLQTQARTLRIGCHIPDYQPDIVAGQILTSAGPEDFQSRALLRWYQKYGHYWGIGNYQKEQYRRVMPILKSSHAQEITSFMLLLDKVESSEPLKTDELLQDTKVLTEFVQALDDMQFAAPTQTESLIQWRLQIRTTTIAVTLECFIPADDPTLVIGLIDSHEGYTYFQSRKLLQWYQKYKDRWLEPDGKEESEEGGEGKKSRR